MSTLLNQEEEKKGEPLDQQDRIEDGFARRASDGGQQRDVTINEDAGTEDTTVVHGEDQDIDRLLQEQPGQETFEQMAPNRIRIVKLVIIIIFVLVFASINIFPNMSLTKIECLFDYTHDYTSPVNNWLKDNKGAKNALLIIGGLMSDFIVLTTLGFWTVKQKTWRFPIALVMVYVTKAIISAVFMYRYPDGYLWENPGFYSLTTPYGSSNDMHFTLHVAVLYVVFQELRTCKLYVLATFAFFVTIYQTSMALFTRGAYCIDLFAAYIFGHFFFIVAERLSYYIDVKIFGLTFQERFPDFITNCSKCSHPINQWTKNSVEDVQAAKRELAQAQAQRRTQMNDQQ